jgi:membrane-bound serine protease (ClpP class)
VIARGSRLVPALLVLSALSTAWAAPLVRVHRHEGVVHGVSADILERVLSDAARDGDVLVVYELDTPGGLVDAAERMVQLILNSKVPVAVFVAPRGAHAASAGFFLLLAGDVAAMAPFTRTGAAHPITAGGENKEGDIALKKAAEDLSALIRTTARARGRPPELAEKAVREAVSWSAEEALEARLIDLVVADREALVRELDGREIVRPDGSRLRLGLAGATLTEHGLDWVEQLKDVVLHPLVMALLLSLAALGIYIELTHPGLILPGAVGAVALLIFLYGSRVLPVNYLAAALVAAGIVFFILEIKVASYGMLGVAGTASIAIGLWLLFPGTVPGLRLPLSMLAPIVLFLAGALGLVAWIVSRAMRRRPTTGREGIVGAIGRATEALEPEGWIFVWGERWRARAARPVAAGQAVRVTGSEGLVLLVEPAPDGAAAPERGREAE